MMPATESSVQDPGAATLTTVEAIYFDLDDTLCAYWDAAKAGILEAFEAHGPPGRNAQEWVQLWGETFHQFCPFLKQTDWYERYLKSGETTRTELMRLTLAKAGLTDEACAKALSASYAERRNAHLSLFDDVRRVLETLHGRYKMGLITNGPADVQRQELETLGIGHFFDAVFIEGEVGEGKPSPAVFARAETAMACAPSQLLFVGNSYRHDIEPALRAGWFAAWVRRPSDVAPSSMSGLPESRPEGRPMPHHTLRHLCELLPLLGLGELSPV